MAVGVTQSGTLGEDQNGVDEFGALWRAASASNRGRRFSVSSSRRVRDSGWVQRRGAERGFGIFQRSDTNCDDRNARCWASQFQNGAHKPDAKGNGPSLCIRTGCRDTAKARWQPNDRGFGAKLETRP